MGDILEYIHGSADRVDGYIINPAGLTTMCEAVRHALEDTTKPAMEVHFANLSGAPGTPRGLASVKLISTFTPTATGLCMGLRQHSYLSPLWGVVLVIDYHSS